MSSPGTSCCLGSRVPHNQRRGWGYLSRRNLDESGRIRPVERKDVERAEKRWAHRSYHNASRRVPEQTDKEFRHTTCNWLRFEGRLREFDRIPAPHQQEIDAFVAIWTGSAGYRLLRSQPFDKA
jgi:hypothetical protein